MSLIRGIGYFAAAGLTPLLLLVAAFSMAVTDFCFRLLGRKRPAITVPAKNRAASIVIPTWNGRDLLEKYLPSVVAAMARHRDNEIIVVDNASEDGTAEFLREQFPQVRVLRQERNLGFGGGSNAGFRAAKNDIVVLLNNDMRVEPDFLEPLLRPFSDSLVFAVACQIFFSDETRRREETGLTESWWERGRLKVGHRIDDKIDTVFPCAYPGGGSSAFDRRKFLELGGFDELLRPFYWEDHDLGFMAWKRGWKVLYQPASVVIHEHRGTIGRAFSRDHIEAASRTNALLFCWKNIHSPVMLAANLWDTGVTAIFGVLLGKPKGRYAAVAVTRALRRLPEVLRSRWRSHQLAVVSDREALQRQRGGHYRDRFEAATPMPRRLQVLFVSPYPIEPPTHGGGLSMLYTIQALAAHVDVHLLCFVDTVQQIAPHGPLLPFCASAEFLVRKHYARSASRVLLPRVVEEFQDREFAWALHRIMLRSKIDVLQIEYTMMAQYAEAFRFIPCFLFEHDISFQSLYTRFQTDRTFANLMPYLQVLRYELNAMRSFNRVQVCTEENREYLLSFAPELEGRVDACLRAGIDTAAYHYVSGGAREPNTVLFIGSFNHEPNIHALEWFLDGAWPRILERRPDAQFVIAGSGSADPLRPKLEQPSVRHLGFVPDVKELLERCAVLICPMFVGSGVRMKLQEAFACGIPVVSTALGAEGLTGGDGQCCELADTPGEFAEAVLRVLNDPESAAGMALRARRMVERERDSRKATAKLVATYVREVEKLRPASQRQGRPAKVKEALVGRSARGTGG